MSALCDSSRFISFTKNRFEALNEVQCFLEYNGVDLGQVFEVLLTSNDGMLTYWFGGIEIQFVRGFGVWSGSQNAIQMSVELENGKMTKTAAYEYKLRDINLVKKHQFRIKD